MNVNCPICSKSVSWSAQSPYRPFCSKKCQLIDLGEWASEDRKIAADPEPSDKPEALDIEEIEAMLAKQQDDFFKH